MKRCFLVITGLAYGGAETQVIHLAMKLKARGWDVFVVSLTPPKAYTTELRYSGVPLFSLNIRQKLPDPRPLMKLFKLIREWRPCIVHSHMVHANILARLTRLFAPVPVLICTAHSIDERGRRGSGWFRTFLYRVTDPLCDLTTQVSRAGLERYVRIRAVPKEKIQYIPNGVDIESFSPNPAIRAKMRKKLHLEKRFVWLAVGRFDPPKDYPTMLCAFSRVVRKHPKAYLLIAGDGPLRPSIEALAKELGISDRVEFLGIRRDVPELMNAADAYVMSSAWEGMPLVLLEAHASGLPVVATNVGGNSEIVIDGKTGFLVSPRNPEALAQAMIRLMELPEEEKQIMGKLARQHVETNFSLDRVVDLWESLYLELLKKKVLLLGR